MKRNAVWISYDLGVQGDYEGLYAWLDSHGAKECGDSVAFLESYEYRESLPDEMKAEIESAISINNRVRIYVIYAIFSGGDVGGMKGEFLFGGRRGAPPWAGYSPETGDVQDVVRAQA